MQSKYAEEREKLASKLLDCVKQCQIRYGGKTELASERDTQVSELCSSVEAVLSHGLRSSPITSQLATSTLKQVSKLIAGRLNLTDDTPVFWHYVLLFLTPHERERYAVLKNINTDIGRGRSWIRGSLNERTLERYFHYMLESTQLLYAHYEDWALMRDSEHSCMFTNMVAGLNSILFAININNMDLNSSDVANNKSFLKNIKNEPIIVTKVITDLNNKTTNGGRRKQNRKVAKQIITFDDDNNDNNDNDQTSNPFSNNNDDIVTNYSDDIKSISTNSSLESSGGSPIGENTTSGSTDGVNSCPISRTSAINDHSVEIEDEETPATINIIPSTEFCDSSEDLMTPLDTSTHFMVNDELETSSSDRSSVDSLTRNFESLKKENETLKSQLKKYIGAVQMLHTNRDEANLTLLSSTNSDVAENNDSKFDEVKHYESKLIQVAEMHAELMEFNEYLQQQINFKDVVIQRLKKQLNQNTASFTRSNSYDNSTHLRGEVFISIPSAFLSSSSTEVSSSISSSSYHVYQIHIRAGNHEWNIFRRYAHFHALHTQLKKLDPTVAKFKFPPKKTIGNKDAALVEKRRKLLEQYLRKLFDHWPELGACSSRAALEQYLAFFREPSKFEEESKWNNTLRQTLFHSFAGSTTSASGITDIRYNGL